MNFKKYIAFALSAVLLNSTAFTPSALSLTQNTANNVKNISLRYESENSDSITAKIISEDLTLDDNLGNTGTYNTILIKKDTEVTLDLNGFNIYANASELPIIYVDDGATLNIINSAEMPSIITTFSGSNYTNVTGIYLKNGANLNIDGNITISKCSTGILSYGNKVDLGEMVKISNITSENNGAAIFLESGSLVMDKLTQIFNNNNNNGTIIAKDNTSISGGKIFSNVTNYGGGINIVGKNIEIKDTLIQSNTAKISGGGIYISEGSSANIIADITDNIAKNSNKSGSGGGIFIDKNATAEIKGLIYKNSSDYSGGGIYSSFNTDTKIYADVKENSSTIGSAIMLVNALNSEIFGEISKNTASEAGAIHTNNSPLKIHENAKLIGNKSTNYGGALYAYGNSPLDIKGLVSDNTAENGGGIYIQQDQDQTTSTLVNIEAEFKNNSAKSYGGAIFTAGNITLNINKSKFTSNKATVFGGAISSNVFLDFNNESNINLANSTFEMNTSAAGGAILLYKKTLVSSNSTTFNQNKAEKGGAITIYDGTFTADENTIFSNNEASVCGGAISLESDTSFATINNSKFNSNTSKNGSAINLVSGNLSLSGGTFDSNVSSKTGAIMLGKAICNLNGTLVFTNNTGANNQTVDIFLNNSENSPLFNITDKITSTNKIAVSSAKTLTYNDAFVFTQNWKEVMGDANPEDYFVASDNKNEITLINDEAAIREKYIPITSIVLNFSKLTMVIGQTSKLNAIINPTNSTSKNLTYSTNSDIISVDENGVITALETGTATITVSGENDTIKSTCEITVGLSDYHHDVIWTEFNNSSDRNITKSGTYFLTENITVSKDNPITISAKNVLICLAGYSINNNSNKGSAIIVNEGCNLEIADCTYLGKISGGEYGIKTNKNATLTISNITINNTNSAAIYAYESKVTMLSGDISDNNGYGIYIEDSEKNDGFGGLELKNGSINNNKNSAVFAYSGNDADSMLLDIGSVNITNNTAEKGAGLYIGKSFNATVYANITNNTSSSLGAGIYLESGSKGITLAAGKYTIYDNLCGEAQSNLFLPNGALILFKDSRFPSGKIGVTTETLPDYNGTVIGENVKNFQSYCIISDSNLAQIVLEKDRLVIKSLNKAVLFGDVNGDGVVTMSDVTTLQRILASLESFSDYGSLSLTAADVNHDGKATMIDVTTIQRFLADLIDSFD